MSEFHDNQRVKVLKGTNTGKAGTVRSVNVNVDGVGGIRVYDFASIEPLVAPPVDPPPVTPPPPVPSGDKVAALKQLLYDDMHKPSEALPGYDWVDWANTPQRRGFPISGSQVAVPWFVADNVKGYENQSDPLYIESFEFWVYLSSQGKWQRTYYIDKSTNIGGANYAESWNNQNASASITADPDGSGFRVGSMPAGTSFHGYPLQRVQTSANDIRAYISCTRTRLYPGSSAKYVLCSSADKFDSLNAQYPNNSDMGIGRQKLAVAGKTRLHTSSGGPLDTVPDLPYPAEEMF